MGISELVILIAVIIISSLGSNLLIAQRTRKELHKSRSIDYVRQDRVAARVEEAERLLAETNAAVAQRSGSTIEKLDVIHTLVNSQMTSAIQSQYDATRRELAVMIELSEIRRGSGHRPNVHTLAEIDATKARVAELKATLEERAESQKVVDELNEKTETSPA